MRQLPPMPLPMLSAVAKRTAGRGTELPPALVAAAIAVVFFDPIRFCCLQSLESLSGLPDDAKTVGPNM